MKAKVNVFWFRRDLRLEDNRGLEAALQAGLPVLPLFIFDYDILNELEDRDDRRVMFIHQEVTRLHSELCEKGSGLWTRYGKPLNIWKDILKEFNVDTVFTNRDYEPAAKARDQEVGALLRDKGAALQSYKDQVIFEEQEILTGSDSPYSVFTPYKRSWLDALKDAHLRASDSKPRKGQLVEGDPGAPVPLEEMGFSPTQYEFPSRKPPRGIIEDYDETRDYPAQEGTSRMGVHLRFGTVSVREMVKLARALNDTWLNELIWREFYMMVLANHPQVVDQSFKPQYDRIDWENNERHFEAWCEGRTGYPMVDAGMRQLRASGYMHNRVRMVVASFLTKHLLTDWRWGERWFARWLLDYELASNNGGWQWAAGSGNDAAPYFRIFNPESQLDKFDPDRKYVKEWVPEFGTDDYPTPIVEHKAARERALSRYKSALGKG